MGKYSQNVADNHQKDLNYMYLGKLLAELHVGRETSSFCGDLLVCVRDFDKVWKNKIRTITQILTSAVGPGNSYNNYNDYSRVLKYKQKLGVCVSRFCRMIVLRCYHSVRIMYLAYYVFGKSRANLPPIKFNFSVSNAFLRQPAV